MAEVIAGSAAQVTPVKASSYGGQIMAVSIENTPASPAATDTVVVAYVPGGWVPVGAHVINGNGGTFTIRLNTTAISASVAAAATESVDVPILAAAYNVETAAAVRQSLNLLWAGVPDAGVVKGHVYFIEP